MPAARTPIDGQFYQELEAVRVTKIKDYKKVKYCTSESGAAFENFGFVGEGTGENPIRASPHLAWKMYDYDPKHFYVTLFSNASQSLYPNNTISAFTVELPRPIELGPNDK